FSQQTLPAYKRTNDSLETTIIQLFQKGITMSEISELIEKMYGHHYTPQTGFESISWTHFSRDG
ncbi:hypothetical protein CG820_10905, partial [Enterococcus faecium]